MAPMDQVLSQLGTDASHGLYRSSKLTALLHESLAPELGYAKAPSCCCGLSRHASWPVGDGPPSPSPLDTE